jgi:hypothetical protein
VCKYLEIRPSPDRSPPGPSVEKHSGQGTFSEQPDTVVRFGLLLAFVLRLSVEEGRLSVEEGRAVQAPLQIVIARISGLLY